MARGQSRHPELFAVRQATARRGWALASAEGVAATELRGPAGYGWVRVGTRSTLTAGPARAQLLRTAGSEHREILEEDLVPELVTTPYALQ